MITDNCFKATEKMSDLICDNYVLLQAMSRFGLSLGFGDHTVEEVCRMNKVDCDTFLAVMDFIAGENKYPVNHSERISIRALMDYLKEAHHFFLDYQLPSIREKLLEFLQFADNHEVSFLILNFFDAFTSELTNHMRYEEANIFPYVERLLNGEKDPMFNFAKFARSHDQVDTKLTELKDIIIKYLPINGNRYHTNSLLFELFACIEDLDTHSRVEDCMFIPAVLNKEKEMEVQ